MSGCLSKFFKDDKKVDYILEQEILKKYFKSKYTNTLKYHHILVDEAQDLPGKWLALLDAMLNKNEKSDLWVFEDPFQAVRRNITRPDNTRFKKHSLTKVFRNTHNIFEAYQHCHERLRKEVISTNKSFSEKELSPPRIHHDVYGKSPEYISVESTQLKVSLVSSLKRLQREGVAFLDVAVVTCSTEVRDEITNYLETAGIKWENAEEGIKLKYSEIKDDPPVIVDSYQRFKGLEAKVLIFFIPSGWTPRDMDIYVGFSRSFCHLIVIGTSSVIDNIKKDQRGCI